MSKLNISSDKRGAVGRVLDYSIEGRRFEPTRCFWRCRCRIRRIGSGVNSRQLWRTYRQTARRTVWPGTAWRHSTAPSPPPPPSLLLSWRNTQSILLRPILFCIFGMCSPRRKSAATVWTVYSNIGISEFYQKCPHLLLLLQYQSIIQPHKINNLLSY